LNESDGVMDNKTGKGEKNEMIQGEGGADSSGI